MNKVKRYQSGGDVSTYPGFSTNQNAEATTPTVNVYTGSESSEDAGGGFGMGANTGLLNIGQPTAMRRGGKVKKMASGGKAKKSKATKSSASKRGDGCAQRGKTKGRMV